MYAVSEAATFVYSKHIGNKLYDRLLFDRTKQLSTREGRNY